MCCSYSYMKYFLLFRSRSFNAKGLKHGFKHFINLARTRIERGFFKQSISRQKGTYNTILHFKFPFFFFLIVISLYFRTH